jgi:hypothetical protein
MNIQEAFKKGLITERLKNAETVEYHRQPTPAEIRFGEGATHYLDVDIVDAWHQSGRLKRWVKIGGLRYTRG